MTKKNDTDTRPATIGRSLWTGLLALATTTAIAAAPAATAPAPHALPAAKAASGAQSKPKPKPRMDINSASRAQLKTLPGIGDAEADKIIAHRPYLTSTEIVTKAGLPEGVYVGVKRQIIAVPKHRQKAVKSSS